MSTLETYLSKAKSANPEISVSQAHELVQADEAILIDVRDSDETREGFPEGSVLIPRGWLEIKILDRVPLKNSPVLLICGSGKRSLFAGEQIRRLGYTDVRSVKGGFNEWKIAGFPVVKSESCRVGIGADRYSRQTMLSEIGEAGQQKLKKAHAVVIGAGGLGSPCSLYLAAAGVGTLTIIDADQVEISNLHRQILHSENKIGISKVQSALASLSALNSSVKVIPIEKRFTRDNAREIIPTAADVVIDCSDNFATRYAVSDRCQELDIPLVYGSVFRFQGHLAVFGGTRSPSGVCYRCVFPEAPPGEIAPSCTDAGVLGTVPGVIGVFQATEAIKYLCDIKSDIDGHLFIYDALETTIRKLKTRRRADCLCAGSAQGVVANPGRDLSRREGAFL